MTAGGLLPNIEGNWVTINDNKKNRKIGLGRGIWTPIIFIPNEVAYQVSQYRDIMSSQPGERNRTDWNSYVKCELDISSRQY